MQHVIVTLKRCLLFSILAILAFSLFAAGALPAHAYPQAQSDEPVTLRIAAPAGTTLDPSQLSRFDPYGHDLAENLFVGLTRFDPATQQIEPMIAETWSVSEDGLTWTFNLRDDIQWVRYDASARAVEAVRPVQAGDFVYAIQRACDPLRPSPVTANLMIVSGCLTVANAFPEVIDDLFIAREIGARATGPYTLEIDLLYPASYFLTLTSTPEFRPLAREAVAGNAGWTAPGTILTNGPYALQSRTDSEMTLARNTQWPDALEGNVERVEVALHDAGAPSAALTSTDQIDMARLTADEAASLQGRAGDRLVSAPVGPITALGFSFDREIVQIPEARRALALAIDRQALVDQFFPGQAEAPAQFTPAGVVAAPTFDGFTFDPAAARAALSAAGFPDCANLPENVIVLVPEEDPAWLDIGQFLIDQWSSNLGCSPALFEIRSLERTLMIELSHATYDAETVTRSHAWVTQWSADYPDANAWINDSLHCQYGWIRTGRECGSGDADLDRAAITLDTAERAGQYTQAEAAFFGPDGSFPIIPLFVETGTWLQQPWLSGVNATGAARFDLWTIDTGAQPG